MLSDLLAATGALARAGVIRPVVPRPSLLRLGLRMPFTVPSIETGSPSRRRCSPTRRLLEVDDPPPTPTLRIGILSGSALPTALRD